MAIWVKIEKMLEENGIGYYKVYKQNYKEIEFYISIDKKKRLIKFYFSEDFTKPVKIIDCNKKDEPIGPLHGASEINYIKAVIQGLKALDMDTFPDNLDYVA